MSLSFQERFKNKANLMGKQGSIDVEGSTAISKPLNSQLFSVNPPLQSKEKQVKQADKPIFIPKRPQETASSFDKVEAISPRPSRHPEPFKRKQTHSAKPFRNIEAPLSRNDIKTSQGEKFIEEYKPYTLKDYQIIKTDKYFELGGLGPSNLGTEDWKQKKEMMDKRISYAKHVKLANANLPASSCRKPKELEKEVSKNERAIQFAKMIPKPTSKPKLVKAEITPALSTVLEELEKQHLAYKASVEAIKSGL